MSTTVTVVRQYAQVAVTRDGATVVVSGPRAQVVMSRTGAPGASGTGYNHTQTSANSTWTINHNLGYKPSVTPLTVGGVEFDAEVIHISVNQCVVNLVAPLAGTARLV